MNYSVVLLALEWRHFKVSTFSSSISLGFLPQCSCFFIPSVSGGVCLWLPVIPSSGGGFVHGSVGSTYSIWPSDLSTFEWLLVGVPLLVLFLRLTLSSSRSFYSFLVSYLADFSWVSLVVCTRMWNQWWWYYWTFPSMYTPLLENNYFYCSQREFIFLGLLLFWIPFLWLTPFSLLLLYIFITEMVSKAYNMIHK